MILTYAQGTHKSMYVNILRMLSVIDNGNKMHIFVYIYKYTYLYIGDKQKRMRFQQIIKVYSSMFEFPITSN